MTTTDDIIQSTSRFPQLNVIETNILLWLNDDVHKTNDNLETHKKLSRIFTEFKVFDDCAVCLNYIFDIKKQNIILIISGNYSYQVIPIIHDNPHLISIYIYSMNKELDKDLKQYEKVRDIFIKSDEIITQLRIDQRIGDNISMNIYSQSQSGSITIQEQRDARNASFMFFQIFINIIFKMNTEDLTVKRDLIKHFKQIFEENQAQKVIIEEFERQYEPCKAIYWYTRPTFLFEILNKALRNSDFDTLLAFRFFITDLYKQLIDQHGKFLNSFNDNDDPILHVYRGQSISIDELNLLQESKGKFISFNHFLSTSTNPLIARVFASANTMSVNNMTSVLFQFDIDRRVLGTKPYANIQHMSYFPEEEEILISLGSIFRINDIKFDENTQKWIANLSLCSDDDYELKELFKRVNTEVSNGTTSLGWWLYFQGEYDKAKRFFKELLNESSTLNDFDIANCFRGIASTSIAVNEDKEAFIYFEKELKFYENIGDHTETGKTYLEIAGIYCRNNQFELALSCQKKAQELIPPNHHHQSRVRQAMGDIFMKQKEFHLAEDYFNQALTIVKQRYPDNHIQFGEIYGSMARMHYAKKDYEKTLEYFYKQRSIYIKCRRSDHPTTLQIEKNIRIIEKVLENKQVYQQNSQSN